MFNNIPNVAQSLANNSITTNIHRKSVASNKYYLDSAIQCMKQISNPNIPMENVNIIQKPKLNLSLPPTTNRLSPREIKDYTCKMLNQSTDLYRSINMKPSKLTKGRISKMKSLERYFKSLKTTLKAQSELQERIEDNMILNKLNIDLSLVSDKDQTLQLEMCNPK